MLDLATWQSPFLPPVEAVVFVHDEHPIVVAGRQRPLDACGRDVDFGNVGGVPELRDPVPQVQCRRQETDCGRDTPDQGPAAHGGGLVGPEHARVSARESGQDADGHESGIGIPADDGPLLLGDERGPRRVIGVHRVGHVRLLGV